MKPDDLVIVRPEGLYCPQGDFHIDPWRGVPRAVITHAHGDHARTGSQHYWGATRGLGLPEMKVIASIIADVLAAPEDEKALAAGADKVGAEDLLEDMQAGNLDYGRVIATPDMMAVVGRLGKVLGPKGLMPNPKLGTVTPNVAEAVKAAKGGQIEFRVEKAGIIHGGIGKLSFDVEDAIEEAREMRRESASRIVVPDAGGAPLGAPPGGGRLKFP